MDLLYDRRREGFDPLTHFVNLFPDVGEVMDQKKSSMADLTIEEMLKKAHHRRGEA